MAGYNQGIEHGKAALVSALALGLASATGIGIWLLSTLFFVGRARTEVYVGVVAGAVLVALITLAISLSRPRRIP